MNLVGPALLSGRLHRLGVRKTRPEHFDLVPILGAGTAALDLVSAFASIGHLVHGQEAVADKTSETSAIPVLLALKVERPSLLSERETLFAEALPSSSQQGSVKLVCLCDLGGGASKGRLFLDGVCVNGPRDRHRSRR